MRRDVGGIGQRRPPGRVGLVVKDRLSARLEECRHGLLLPPHLGAHPLPGGAQGEVEGALVEHGIARLPLLIEKYDADAVHDDVVMGDVHVNVPRRRPGGLGENAAAEYSPGAQNRQKQMPRPHQKPSFVSFDGRARPCLLCGGGGAHGRQEFIGTTPFSHVGRAGALPAAPAGTSIYIVQNSLGKCNK